ncbi:hypothetical protein MSG28_003753 [Choristoneura fumiferana]|uniref:Uncharacterized protein n=1 Tax=Choristoneura fumiferana TaxID=7141 RepID=A0ACC0KGU4_CHOFU|nr:hypothetical protein MSG28_003753 [Choristoneura fumiferana]
MPRALGTPGSQDLLDQEESVVVCIGSGHSFENALRRSPAEVLTSATRETPSLPREKHFSEFVAFILESLL